MSALLACGDGNHSVIKPLEASAAAQKYLVEFRSNPTSTPEATSPDKSSKVELSSDGSCHTLWIVSGSGPKAFVIRAQEADPGSGLSFGWRWSKDSKALFLVGNHSGLDCRSKIQGGLNVIYTAEDKSLWAVPPK